MSANSKIGWTEHTFCPWWGCHKVSSGCANCYAEVWARRKTHCEVNLWGTNAPRKVNSDKYWAQPYTWDRKASRQGKRAKVFCNSMGDVFEDRRDLDAPRSRLWQIIEDTPNLDWLLLTKRPENMNRLVPPLFTWPDNLWAGTTVENEDYTHRIDTLREVPAKVRFLSLEPLLGPLPNLNLEGINWVIVEGESGARYRPCDPRWVRDIRDQCLQSKTAFYFKGWGTRNKTKAGRLLDGRAWNQSPSGEVMAEPLSGVEEVPITCMSANGDDEVVA